MPGVQKKPNIQDIGQSNMGYKTHKKKIMAGLYLFELRISPIQSANVNSISA
jgi:hypothetical protein